MQFLRFPLSSLFWNETQHLCSVRCADYELDKEFLRLELYFDFESDIFEICNPKIFKLWFIPNYIRSNEKHGLAVLASVVQFYRDSFSRIKSGM